MSSHWGRAGLYSLQQHIKNYKASLTRLKDIHRTGGDDDVRKVLADVFFNRDQLEARLDTIASVRGSIPPQEFTIIEDLDRTLEDNCHIIFRRQWIDLENWRQVRGDVDRLGWWWHFDQRYLRTRPVNWFMPIRFGVYLLLSLGILRWSLESITQTANIVAGVALRVFSTISVDDLGLDVITIVTILAQVFLSGSFALAGTNRFSLELNRIVAGFRLGRFGFLRRYLLIPMLPVARLLIFSVMFASVAFFISRGTPVLSEQLRRTSNELSQPVSSQLTVYETASLLDPAQDYAVDLTRLAIQLEKINDLEGARELYEQALSSAPTALVAIYQLTGIYTQLDPDDPQLHEASLRLLDRALREIAVYKVQKGTGGSAEELQEIVNSFRVLEENTILQLEALLLTRRADVFHRMQRPDLARRDVDCVVNIISERDVPRIRLCERVESGVQIPEIEIYMVGARVYSDLFFAQPPPSNERPGEGRPGSGRPENDSRGNHRDPLAITALLYADKVIQLADESVGIERMWASEANNIFKNISEESARRR